MLKRWICCLCIVGSLATLVAQTESTPNTMAGKTWLEGGAENAYESSAPLPYAGVREADIMWEKRVWRVIDTREKINLTFRHPEFALFSVLAEGLAAGALSAYSPEDDRFNERVSSEEILSQLNKSDTVTVIDPVTGDFTVQVVTNNFDPERIKRWRVQEVWYFDTRYSEMKVRIIGIAPLVETTISDGDGELAFESPIFWINYAEARPWLAQHTAIIPGNDHSRTSWEDLFAMRRFDSYVYKENDMRGRRLEDYLSGTDLLLESEKIDRTIQNKEMDMWSY
ncbi:gliding motility protein GldN [Lewinella cohaerens]|uniref:type IX secretion system ring protein PorN/GldN n=1 Tax=Lewinella cohaerens TaxID=70995 RepID=UPI0003752CE6|nr:gliding motility protein GldN [Lewinella cohaerens]